MRKNERHSIYFTMADLKALNCLAKKRNESKSAVVRKLVYIEKYADTLNEIETSNRIISEFLKELKHVGVNLNQIAYHLNANITGREEAKNDLEKNMRSLAGAIKKLSKQIDDLKVKIDVKHTKTPSSSGTKGEENG